MSNVTSDPSDEIVTAGRVITGRNDNKKRIILKDMVSGEQLKQFTAQMGTMNHRNSTALLEIHGFEISENLVPQKRLYSLAKEATSIIAGTTQQVCIIFCGLLRVYSSCLAIDGKKYQPS
jgi:hypothetical protein